MALAVAITWFSKLFKRNKSAEAGRSVDPPVAGAEPTQTNVPASDAATSGLNSIVPDPPRILRDGPVRVDLSRVLNTPGKEDAAPSRIKAIVPPFLNDPMGKEGTMSDATLKKAIERIKLAGDLSSLDATSKAAPSDKSVRNS